MKSILTALICVATIIAAPAAIAAGKPKKPKAYTPPPTPTPPPVPSVDLSKFSGVYLGQILGPLDQKVPLPRAELAQIRASIAARFSKASLAERNQFQTALAVCDAISQAMDERQKATTQNQAAMWTQRAEQLRANINQLMEREKAAESSASAPSPGR